MSTDLVKTGPAVYVNPNLQLGIVYNPFIPNDIVKTELVYDEAKSLAVYMNGLPEEVEWALHYDGRIVPEIEWPGIFPKPGSYLCLVRVPEGGGSSGKSILRIVALIAVMVVAAAVGGPLAGMIGGAIGLTASATAVLGAVLTTAIGIGGALLVNALMPAQQSPQGGATYGIDGPKNTSQEGIPVPVVYGEFRLGGNVVDCYTVNVGDDQYLFMRTVLNDGTSQSVGDIELNQQPIGAFQEVEYRVQTGEDDQTTNDWFSSATRQQTVNQLVTQAGINYITTTAVDQINLDFAFPLGLIHINSKGAKGVNGVTFVMQYRPVEMDGTPIGDGTYTTLPLQAQAPIDTSADSGIYEVGGGLANATFTILPTVGDNGSYSVAGFYRAQGSTTWIPYTVLTGTASVTWTYGNGSGTPVPPIQQIGQLSDDVANGVQNNTTVATTTETIQYKFNFPSRGEWEVMFTGGAIEENTTQNIINYSIVKDINVPGQINDLNVTAITQTPFRVSFYSQTLTNGYYELQVSRVEPDLSTDVASDSYISQVYLTDVAEVVNEDVLYYGTTMLALKIRLNDQLSGIPTLTALVQGCDDVNQYDEEGNVTSTGYSNNPAWVVLDILLNPKRGCEYSGTRIDFPGFVEWAEFCDTNGYLINGAFDQVQTLWDSIQAVAAIGHAYIVPQGTRYTPVIDQASSPTMIFTGSNMYKDTFKKTWTNLADRANEIQQQYYDQLSDYATRTIRLPDVNAQSLGLPVKASTMSGFGINNVTQATSEAEYQARKNSYTISTVSFDAPIEAIGLSIGDVALIQHDSVNYAEGVGGRIEADSTTTVFQLDRPVTMTADNTYSILITNPAVEVYPGITITAISGNRLTVTGIPESPASFSRLIQGDTDVDVTYVVDQGGGNFRLTVDNATDLVTGIANLWATDVIQEYAVDFVEGESMSVTVASAAPVAPDQYWNFLFGQTASIQQPYRLRSISGQDDLFRRTLTFTNYDSRVYDAGSWGVPTLATYVTPVVNQARSPHVGYNTIGGDNTHVACTLNWKAPIAPTIYGGADIYQQLNGDTTWQPVATVSNVCTWGGTYSRGDAVIFKVVAFDTYGNRAINSSAPTVGVTLNPQNKSVDPPTSLTSSIPTYTDLASVNVAWTASDDSDANTMYRIEWQTVSADDYATFEAADGVVANFPSSVSGNTGWTVLPLTPDVQMTISRLSPGDIVVRVCAKHGYAHSDWAFIGVAVPQATMPATITGLHVDGHSTGLSTDTFTGADCNLSWDDILTQAATLSGASQVGLPWAAKDYKVVVKAVDGTELRTEYITQPHYSYTFSKNCIDAVFYTGGVPSGAIARRAFHVSVEIRGAQGQLTTPVTMILSNPAPGTEAVAAALGPNSVTLTYATPTDADAAGIIVWASETSGFTPGPSNLVYQGPGNAFWNVTPFQTLYFVYGIYDAFGTDEINLSIQHSVSTIGAMKASIDPAVIATLSGLANNVLPSTFGQGDTFFTTDFSDNDPEASPPSASGWTYPTVSGVGPVAQITPTTLESLGTLGRQTVVAGRTYQATMQGRVLTDDTTGASCRFVLYFEYQDSTGTHTTGQNVSVAANHMAADGWFTLTVTTTAAAVLADSCVTIQPVVKVGQTSALVSTTGATMQIVSLQFDDITQSSAAASSASAAAASAAAAAASAASPATIGTNSVTNTGLAQMAAATLKGNNGGSTADAADLTATQVKSMLAISTSDVSGLGSFATQSTSSPPAIGTTAPNTGAFTTLTASGAPPSPVTGLLFLGGASSATPTMSGNDQGGVYLSTAGGLNLIGQGSVNDIVLRNSAGAIVARVATGSSILTAQALAGDGSAITNLQAVNVTGLAASAFTDTTVAGNISSGTLLAVRLPAFTGDVTSPAGSSVNTIAANIVANSKLAQMAAGTLKGNNSGSTANAADLTVSQVKTMLSIAASDLTNGATGTGAIVLASGASITNLAVTGALASPAAGTLLLGGSNSPPTFGAANEGAVYVNNVNGLVLMGQGATNDVIVRNSAGTIALKVPTGTTNVTVTGNLAAANLTGTNTGDQTITLSGDVTGSGTAGITSTISANAVSNAKLAQMSANTLKGNNTSGTANAADLTASQVKTLLAIAVGDLTTSSVGTGAIVLANSPSLITPNLGVPSAINLSNATNIPAAQLSGYLPAANFPALSGDVNTSPGSLTSSVVRISGQTVAGVTGTSNVVFSSSPTIGAATLTGTTTAAAINASGAIVASTFSGNGASITNIAVANIVGLSASATTDTTNAGNISTGTLAAARMPALTGDVTTSAGAVATTIAANIVSNSKLAQMAATTLKGNNGGSTANAADLTVSQVKTMLAYQASDLSNSTSGTGAIVLASGATLSGATLSGTTTAGAINSSGTVAASLFSGSGASLTSLPASQLTGTVAPSAMGTITLTGAVKGAASGGTVATTHGGVPGMYTSTATSGSNPVVWGTNNSTYLFNTALTAALSITLEATGSQVAGDRWTIIRGPSCTGAYALTVYNGGPAGHTAYPYTKQFASGSSAVWCEFEYNGTDWCQISAGSL